MRFSLPSLCLLGLTLLGPACKKAEVAPTVGDLVINFNALPTRPYTLYTEVGWAGPNYTLPLRQGQVVGSAAPGRYAAALVLSNLNAGNYVFSLGGLGGLGQSVQVVAGTTTEVTSTL